MPFVQAWTGISENEAGIDITTEAKTTTSGNTIVVGFGVNSFNSIADGDCTDNKGNAYTRIGNVGLTNAVTLALFYATNILGGAGHTIRCQRSDANDGAIVAVELGTVLASPFDVSKTAGTGFDLTGSTFDTGTVVSNATDDLVAVFVVTAAGTWLGGSGYTSRSSVEGNIPMLMETQDGVAAGSVGATASKGSSMGYAGMLAAFKVSAGGPARDDGKILIAPVGYS